MAVYVIAGPPCSGKTTLTRRRAQPGDVVLDFDDIAVELGSPHRWHHTPAIRRRADQVMRRRMLQLHRHAGDAYVIRCAANPRLRTHLARTLGATVWVLDPGEAECVRRARTDRRPPGTEAAIRRWYARFQPSPVDAPLLTQRVVSSVDAVFHPASREW